MYPNYICPRGYYCLTNTSQPFKLCEVGNYCAGTDYPCLDGFICKRGAFSYFGEGQCPPGFYCKGYSIKVCPSRYYCEGYGNSMPTACPSGTYNPFVGQTSCIICPLGAVCPSIMMLYYMPCPKGYICDQEGLIFPIKLCTPGYYCGESVATTYLNSPCFTITESQALIGGFCEYDILVAVNDPINNSGSIDEFGMTPQNLCCWNVSRTGSFVSQISNKTSFSTVANEFIKNGFIGLNLYNYKLTHENSSILSYFSTNEDQSLFYFNLVQVTSMQKPAVCKSGVYCLEGIISDNINTKSVRSARICNPGTYCPSGTSTPAGQICPSGYHCPAGSSAPIPNSPGTSTSFSGNVIEGQCSPNYFTNQNASQFCHNCSNGYECTSSGTIWPSICLLGNFRNHIESTICSNCPVSTYSYDFGIINSYECQSCDAGRICLLTVISNITLSSPCTQGDVCEEAADISLHSPCPAGFLCDSGTSPSTQYDIPCISGFYCKSSMKFINKYLYPCPNSFYCPPATIDYSAFYTEPSTSNATSFEVPPTTCPLGTGKISEGSRNSLLNCEMLTNYTGNTPILEINPIFIESSAKFIVYEHNGKEVFIFHLEPRHVSLITIDLRHLNITMINYGVDWAISFTILPNISDATTLQSVPMPESFLKPKVEKTGVFEFTIMA